MVVVPVVEGCGMVVVPVVDVDGSFTVVLDLVVVVGMVRISLTVEYR